MLMKTFTSDTHRAELSLEGVLNVFPLEGRKIQETSFDGEKVRVAEHTAKDGSPVLRNLLHVMDNLPLFRTAFAGNGVFHLDYETGTQRWKGYKPTEAIRDALIKCKFTTKDIVHMISSCERTIHPFLPKV
jgi:hypothetical protein